MRVPTSIPIDSIGKQYSELPTNNRQRSKLTTINAPRRRQQDQMLPNSFLCLSMALPFHQLGWALLGAHLSLCLRCRLVSPIRDLCNLPDLLHIILRLPAHPYQLDECFPSGFDAGTRGRRPHWLHTTFVVQNIE